jgi:C4-dicarboxylate-specific signal transduction histidine kinase
LSPRPSPSIDSLPLHAADVVAEVVAEFRTECQSLAGVSDVCVLFRDEGGSFVDETGRERIPPGSPAHPVLQAATLGRSVSGAWEPAGTQGMACPLQPSLASATVVWFALTEERREEESFLLEQAARRLERQLGRAALAWTAERRLAALNVAENATGSFLTETSLHRALRLCATDLAELAAAKEVSIWRWSGSAEPVCLAQIRNGTSESDRQRHVVRLLGELATAPQRVRVTNTSRSPHHAWCQAEGIQRFVAHPITAYDRFYGYLLVIDYTPSLALGGELPPPGLDEATGVVAAAAAKAFYQVDLQDQVGRLRADLRAAERLAEQGRRDSAHLDLARQAASALEDALRENRQITAEIRSSRVSEDLDAFEASAIRAIEILDELTLLCELPPSRLRLTDLNDVICGAVEAVRESDGPPSSVSLRLQGDLPKLLLDGDRVRRVLTTLLEHGLSGTEERQATVASRLQASEVLVEIRIPNRRVQAGILDSLFLPFMPQNPNAPTGSLALADQVVGEHGGQLRARSDAKEGLFFGLSFPVNVNQERRSRRRDRRAGRDRRRDAEPE